MPTGSTNSRDRVAQLVTEAAADSSGCFTLDPQAFWPKACQLRMAEPYHYLRCIFRGLVVLGAQWVHLAVDADDVYVCSDIDIPSVDNLMGYLFSPDPSAWPLQ